ncbi:MAG: hypothetical protein EAX89_03220 [Candidatus Lokiarchaeota archaeon]|nr:hypothetical protein [Candidatus Lokiarchaeota archaeon]
MNFFKSFLITILVYLGLNTVFVLTAVYTTTGFPTSDVLLIVALIFAPSSFFPAEVWATNGIVQLINTTNFVTDFMVFIGAIVPPLVAIILASFLAESPKESVAAWGFTVIISCIIYAILYAIGQTYSTILNISWVADMISYGAFGTILVVLIGGVANFFFYGCIAFLISRKGL